MLCACVHTITSLHCNMIEKDVPVVLCFLCACVFSFSNYFYRQLGNFRCLDLRPLFYQKKERGQIPLQMECDKE